MFYDPPYVLLIAGLLAGITCGRAFEMTLRQAVQEWSKTRSTRTLEQLKGTALTVPFMGICAGICVFLASGLSIYGIPSGFSYAFSVPMTIGIAALVWFQLQKVLILLQEGGSRALDLDALE
ncbi:MAG: hypothetical protein HC852_01340 [Acaryochloridaceae cyanobacterium RU_4_10]|nr:hypothetical protein [Acaryochloridaceae cyanobacterium RU_4_10]